MGPQLLQITFFFFKLGILEEIYILILKVGGEGGAEVCNYFNSNCLGRGKCSRSELEGPSREGCLSSAIGKRSSVRAFRPGAPIQGWKQTAALGFSR